MLLVTCCLDINASYQLYCFCSKELAVCRMQSSTKFQSFYSAVTTLSDSTVYRQIQHINSHAVV
jgi:hypothetical protein